MSQIVDAVDLVVLVADKDLEEAVEALLARTGDLQLRPFRFEVRRHPNRDGGCRTGAANFLRPFLQRYRRSLVLFDRDGCGSSRSRTEIQREVDADLARNGWADRTKAIGIRLQGRHRHESPWERRNVGCRWEPPERARFEAAVWATPAYAGGGSLKASGTVGSRARDISAVSVGRSRPR